MYSADCQEKDIGQGYDFSHSPSREKRPLFWAKCHYIQPLRSLLYGCTRRNIKKLYIFNSSYLLDSCSQSLKWSFLRGQKRFGHVHIVFLQGFYHSHFRRVSPPLSYGSSLPGAEHSCVYDVASQLEKSCYNDKYWVRVLHILSQFPSVRLVDFSMLLKKNVEPSATLKQLYLCNITEKKIIGVTLDGISNSSTGHHDIETPSIQL